MQKGSLVFCSSFWSRRGVWLLSMAASTRGCFTVSAGSMGARNNCVSVRGTQMQQLGHYNREFLNFFWAFLAGVFSINIESYELSCKRVVQFVNGYSKPH